MSRPQSNGGIGRYQDALSEGVFRMQRRVDSVACNKDTFLCLRSSCLCPVSLPSGVWQGTCADAKWRRIAADFRAKGRFLSRVDESGETSGLFSRMADRSGRSVPI